MYNKVTSEDIAVLQKIVGEGEVFFGDAINEDYAHDELGGISDALAALREMIGKK